ncbi:MAG TPA: hypothetical protein VM123_18950 [archaeon]|nr:hypothetical protein [archaeon]
MNKRLLYCRPRSARFLICRLLAAAVLSWAVFGLSCGAPADEKANQPQLVPNAELAQSWWPPLRNVWTPIGWKDHLFRFHVLYNGTVVANPHFWHRDKALEEKWSGQSVQLTVTPSADGKIPEMRARVPYQLASGPDCGVGNQGWTANPTPVLWTEWPRREGLVLREEIFAHLPGAGDIESSVEPLYAWIRFSVSHVDKLQAPENFSFVIHLGADNIAKSMEHAYNLKVYPERSAYPRKLTAESFSEGTSSGLRIREEDKKIRLMGISSSSGRFTFTAGELPPDYKISTSGKDYYLVITLPVRKGAQADLLLPMMPGDREQVDVEMALGFEGALVECNRYWSIVPRTASKIETPEPQVNEAIGKSVKFAQVIAIKNPETGEFSFLSGSWHYERLWATPTSMTGHMLLDNLGYHSVVEKHIELFRKNQGSVKPPGSSYKLHPGYFSTPRTLTSIDWLTDNGAVLYEVSKHALFTGDREFIDRWLEAIIKSCEFIKEARATPGHDGVPGVLPPAVATDREIPTQSVWNIGWNYKGLSTAVRLLERIGHPRAEEFTREARDYKETFIKALREATVKMPRWTGRDGQTHPIVPSSLSAGGDIFHAFYLDAGPLFLVWSGILEANDELMQSTAAFFREGPNTRLFDPRDDCWQRPVLIHEISSCEPCYSWNIYHSWQLGDRCRFFEGLYSLLAGALSRQTYISCETRHGIYGNIFAAPLVVDLVRLSVIDDVIRENELHLLRLVPAVWLRTDFETKFINLPTEFGPVTLRFKITDSGKTLDLAYRTEFRQEPEKVVLHVPLLAGLAQVRINGRAEKAKPGDLIVLD